MRQHKDFLLALCNKKMLIILLLGYSSGLPLPLLLSTLTIWLAEENVTKTQIGLFALATLPYTLKFLWAPLIDNFNFKFLARYRGNKASWILITQIILIGLICYLAFIAPAENIILFASICLAIAFFSATQDIAIDAYRIELFSKAEQGAAAAVQVFGYRAGMLLSGAGALIAAQIYSWQAAYIICGASLILGMFAIIISPKPTKESLILPDVENFVQDVIWKPFAVFMQENKSWIMIIIFIIFYKFSDAILGTMPNVMFIELGYSKSEIAAIVKSFGLFATIFGGFVGAYIVYKVGVYKSLFICGILQILSNLVFILQYKLGYDLKLLSGVIFVENITSGMGTAALVAYLSNLCNVKFAATQYALLSSLASIGRLVLGGSSGYIVDNVGWVNFFILSMIIALPALYLIIKLESLDRGKNVYRGT